MNIKYQIEFHDYWHAGSGLSGGVLVDSEVIKTIDGLPYIPGKTLKGLIRDAAKTLKSTDIPKIISENFIEEVLGTKTQSSSCHFSNAYLSTKIQTHFETKHEKEILFQSISSTAIGKEGQAENSSLRTIQVTIPLVLYAEINGFPEKTEFQDSLKYCFQYIKRMGQKRHRGLGRCDWSILK